MFSNRAAGARSCGAAFADPRSLNPAQPRAFYAGLKATF
jgi:hypothetical protein